MAQSNELTRIQAYGHIVTVDLATGNFIIDGVSLPFRFARHVDVEYPITGELRPIKFRRVTKQFNVDTLAQCNEIVVHAIGWQATVEISEVNEKLGKWVPKQVNVKHILYLHPDGSLVFG